MVAVLLVLPMAVLQERIHFGVSLSLNSSRNLPILPEVEGEVAGSDYMMPNPGARLLLFHNVWLANGCHPRVVHILEWGYKIILQKPNRIVKASNDSNVKEEGHNPNGNVHNSGADFMKGLRLSPVSG